MAKYLLKIACGVVIGILINCVAEVSYVPLVILLLLWGTGMVFGFTTFLSWFQKALPSSLQLGVLSFMTIGNGILGMFVIIVLFSFVITLGWIYGIFLCVRELIGLLK